MTPTPALCGREPTVTFEGVGVPDLTGRRSRPAGAGVFRPRSGGTARRSPRHRRAAPGGPSAAAATRRWPDQAGFGPFDQAGQLADLDVLEPGPPVTSSARSLPCAAARPARACRRSAHQRLNWLAAREWNVPAMTGAASPRLLRRWRSSPAALRVKVIATSAQASAPPLTIRYPTRRVRTRVLPAPAEASTHTVGGGGGDRRVATGSAQRAAHRRRCDAPHRG